MDCVPRVRLELSMNVMDRALWLASWIEGEAGTVKTLISSICVLFLTLPLYRSFPRGLAGPHLAPTGNQGHRTRRKQMFLQKSRV